MRYHHKQRDYIKPMYGELYICDHPVYSRCTLYKIRDKGLAVIQQKYDPETKMMWWSEIADWRLANDLYLHDGFKKFFDSRADLPKNGLYPTVTIRQIMWHLRMKPLKRERWETYFDRKEV